jgi:hypothetical protein
MFEKVFVGDVTETTGWSRPLGQWWAARKHIFTGPARKMRVLEQVELLEERIQKAVEKWNSDDFHVLNMMKRKRFSSGVGNSQLDEGVRGSVAKRLKPNGINRRK